MEVGEKIGGKTIAEENQCYKSTFLSQLVPAHLCTGAFSNQTKLLFIFFNLLNFFWK
jgi:hypothetical protein